MQLETRVVNLGKRGGLVVRRFQIETQPAYTKTPQILLYGVQSGLITLMEAEARLAEMGYSPSEIEIWLVYMAGQYFRDRKEVDHG